MESAVKATIVLFIWPHFKMARLSCKFKLRPGLDHIFKIQPRRQRSKGKYVRLRFNYLCVAALVGLSAAAFAACSGSRGRGIELEPTPVVSGGPGWGVVSMAYVRLLAEPSWAASENAAGRRGEVGRILGRARSQEPRDSGIWYEIETDAGKGWIHESALTVYRRKEEALKASEGSR